MKAPSSLSITAAPHGVCHVQMNRPDIYNALDETMIAEMDEAFAELAADSATRVVVLSGAGKHFSAGADLRWMQRQSEASPEENRMDALRFARMLHRIAGFPKPTLARIQGAALGGGVGLACCCDIAVAADTSSFAVSEVRFGLMPAIVGPHLVNAIGIRQARRLALTAERITAAEALQIGLVHRTAAIDQLDESVRLVLDELMRAGPHAQAETKRYLTGLRTGPISAETLELSALANSGIRSTPEAREGFAAFLDKRPPNWMAS